jgi:hypothetical protein
MLERLGAAYAEWHGYLIDASYKPKVSAALEATARSRVSVDHDLSCMAGPLLVLLVGVVASALALLFKSSGRAHEPAANADVDQLGVKLMC